MHSPKDAHKFTTGSTANIRNEFLPFSRPCISEEEINAVSEVLRSGWITTGTQCARFEEVFAEYCGARASVALASATAGMHLLLQALNIGPGDEVITPSMTWISTVNLIVRAGATPIFADIAPDTLLTSAKHIAALISKRTRLIVPVHMAGAALDLKPLRELARQHDIHLVEDAAHAAGTEYNQEKIGGSGTAIFSFHPIKNMTCGEGGMLCTDSVELAERIRRLRFHGLGVDAYDRKTQGRAPQAEVIEPGYKYNLTDIAAALGIAQLSKLDDFIARRTILAGYYHDLLSGVDEIQPLAIPESTSRHAWHLFIVRLDIARTGMSRNQFMEKLKCRNVGTGCHFRAVHTHKYFRKHFSVQAGALSATEWNSERICSLPLFPDMDKADVQYVVNSIKGVLSRG